MSTGSSPVAVEVKRITRVLSARPPQGQRRIRLLRERARLEAVMYDGDEPVEDEGPAECDRCGGPCRAGQVYCEDCELERTGGE